MFADQEFSEPIDGLPEQYRDRTDVFLVDARALGTTGVRRRDADGRLWFDTWNARRYVDRIQASARWLGYLKTARSGGVEPTVVFLQNYAAAQPRVRDAEGEWVADASRVSLGEQIAVLLGQAVKAPITLLAPNGSVDRDPDTGVLGGPELGQLAETGPVGDASVTPPPPGTVAATTAAAWQVFRTAQQATAQLPTVKTPPSMQASGSASSALMEGDGTGTAMPPAIGQKTSSGQNESGTGEVVLTVNPALVPQSGFGVGGDAKAQVERLRAVWDRFRTAWISSVESFQSVTGADDARLGIGGVSPRRVSNADDALRVAAIVVDAVQRAFEEVRLGMETLSEQTVWQVGFDFRRLVETYDFATLKVAEAKVAEAKAAEAKAAEAKAAEAILDVSLKSVAEVFGWDQTVADSWLGLLAELSVPVNMAMVTVGSSESDVDEISEIPGPPGTGVGGPLGVVQPIGVTGAVAGRAQSPPGGLSGMSLRSAEDAVFTRPVALPEGLVGEASVWFVVDVPMFDFGNGFVPARFVGNGVTGERGYVPVSDAELVEEIRQGLGGQDRQVLLVASRGGQPTVDGYVPSVLSGGTATLMHDVLAGMAWARVPKDYVLVPKAPLAWRLQLGLGLPVTVPGPTWGRTMTAGCGCRSWPTRMFGWLRMAGLGGSRTPRIAIRCLAATTPPSARLN